MLLSYYGDDKPTAHTARMRGCSPGPSESPSLLCAFSPLDSCSFFYETDRPYAANTHVLYYNSNVCCVITILQNHQLLTKCTSVLCVSAKEALSTLEGM